MTVFIEKHRKKIFYTIIAITFLMIYVYNFLTPYLSDDYAYLLDVKEAASLWDLVKQQYREYLSNSGRIIGQFNVRLSLSVSKHLFNVVNSGMFVALILLMYQNIRRRKKHDIFVLLLIITFIWRFAVDFGQTMLWICGACNYLWGSVLILGFFTFYRYLLEHAEKIRHGVLAAVITFFFGVLAGWCNENTSGGGLLLVLMYSLNFFLHKEKKGKKIYPFMLSGIVGVCCGLLGMISAPGVRMRSSVMSEDAYTGIVGLLSRIYKTTVTVRKLFFPLLLIMIIVLALLVLQKKLLSFRDIRFNDSILFLTASVATAYALILAPTPQNRAFFGAGVFLMIACIQGIMDVKNNDITLNAIRYSLVSALCLWLFFTYMENLVNLARILREEKERIAIIYEEKNNPEGEGIAIVPQYREAFQNPYSAAHVSDMTKDEHYWINFFYENYYGVKSVIALPRDEWDELYGDKE